MSDERWFDPSEVGMSPRDFLDAMYGVKQEMVQAHREYLAYIGQEPEWSGVEDIPDSELLRMLFNEMSAHVVTARETRKLWERNRHKPIKPVIRDLSRGDPYEFV